MATNIKQGQNGYGVCRIGVVATSPASPASGDPVRAGELLGVAEGAINTDTSITVINLDCIAEVSVKGVDGSGNVAVSAGDIIYFVDADTPKLSKKTAGRRFGIAIGKALGTDGVDTRSGTLVASGATGTIRVLVGH